MATIKKRSTLGKIFKTKSTQTASAASEEMEKVPLLVGGSSPYSPAWGNFAGGNGNKWAPRIRTKKNMQWESHMEKINGYYFRLEGETRVCAAAVPARLTTSNYLFFCRKLDKRDPTIVLWEYIKRRSLFIFGFI